ncbi:MAG: SpoIIE family protein phosphatase [Bacteroidia bacterium]|nr:SpoIIE family protein phosphatase [Bacteroidia bacterium]MCZ2247330.1 SpoIIE family protein phosphatase [Bacteroidia bacterium]
MTIFKKVHIVLISYILCLFAGISYLKAQHATPETGLPYIVNYSAKQYKAHDQNWCIVSDSLGIIYIGNNIGILVFDGLDIDVINSETAIYSLAKDQKGNIYYGGEGDFGRIEPTDKGKLKLNSITHLIPEKERNFAEVWSIRNIDNKMVFSTRDNLYVYEEGKISVIKPIKGKGIHKSFLIKNKYLAREFEAGFSYLDGNTLKFIEGSEVFSDLMVDFVNEADGKIIIGTRSKGFYTMYWDETNDPGHCKILPLEFPVSSYFKDAQLYEGIKLSDGNFGFATKNNGIFIADKHGNLIEHFTKEKGILDNKVWYLMEEKGKNLWAATDKGVSMIDYHSPIRQYNYIQGLVGAINDVSFINNKLYINTDRGIVEGIHTNDGIVFKSFNEIKSSSFSSTLFKTDQTNEVIVATEQGLASIKNNKATFIDNGVRFYNALQYSKDKNILIAVGKDIIVVYRYENGSFKILSEYECESNLRFIIEDNNGIIWVSGDNKTLIKFNPLINDTDKYKHINLRNHIDNKSENQIIKFKDRILLTTIKGVHEITNLESDEPQINKSKLFSESYQFQQSNIFRIFSDKYENFWIAYDYEVDSKKGVIAFCKKQKNNIYESNNLLFNKYLAIQKNGFCEDNAGNIWIATNEGLLKYNTILPYKINFSFPVFIKKVTLKNDSSYILTRGLVPKELQNELPFSMNAIDFRFSVANFTNAENIFFSTRLLPNEKKFTEWSLVRTKDFNYLAEGTYTLEVKARDIFYNESGIKRITFTIAPPWYRTLWAYFLYFVLANVAIYFIIKFNTKRLRALNDLLEKTVKERTQELWKERDKLREANQEITDSINYAKIIQQSILPESQAIKKVFKQSFIYFKPRNIVSGDFYWFSQLSKSVGSLSKNLHIIAAADCTGHGVPGAFMSMIGNEKLNQAITEIPDLTPSTMLKFLNQHIKDSLRQEEGRSLSKDGMEISLCFFNTETNMLTFSGANRPLWIFRKGCSLEEVEIIKPTKAAIAGHTSINQEYEEVSIQLNTGDTLYMFTDGAPDQFGGPDNKKITTKGFRKLLFDIQSLNMDEQRFYISKFYHSWMRDTYEQIDDILIIGIKI